MNLMEENPSVPPELAIAAHRASHQHYMYECCATSCRPSSVPSSPAKPGGSVVVDLLFYVWVFCVGLCFGMHYFISFLVLQSS